ncbi:MAG: HAMP domain-containing histidine kinase [Planctomycetes bacterium]|nr:HAMP domain-containing histidine kinase [Planctomycetota bacterium]
MTASTPAPTPPETTSAKGHAVRRASWRSLEPQVLSDERLLGARSRQLVWIRLLLATAIIAGALVGRYVANFDGLDVPALVATGLAVAFYDLVAWRLVVRKGETSSDPKSLSIVESVTYGAIVLDYVALAFVVWNAGGTRSPLLSFFLLHAIVSGVMLGRRPALTLHALAYVLLVAMVALEWSGAIRPPTLPTSVTGGVGPIDGRYALAVAVAYGAVFAITAFILTSFSSSLRRSDRAIRDANAELTRLADMRRDFLDIALHNLQSPVAAVRMHVGNVLDGHGGPVTDKQREWLTRGIDRLERLGEFMRALSILSTIESVRIEERASPVDLPTLLDEIVRDHQDAAQQNGLTLGLDVPVPPARVQGMELLLREAVVNYVTNAIKYVPHGGHAVVRARLGAPGRVRIEVGDDGRGIAPEDVQQLFREFVRLREKGKPVPKAGGSGLGLTIVRRVAELHGGSAGVTSEPGRGSTFWIDLPLAAEPPGEPTPAS